MSMMIYPYLRGNSVCVNEIVIFESYTDICIKYTVFWAGSRRVT